MTWGGFMIGFFTFIALLSFFQTGLIIDFYFLNKRKLVFNLPKFFGLGIGFIGILQLTMGLLNFSINQNFVFIFFLIFFLPFIFDKNLTKKVKKQIIKNHKLSVFQKLSFVLFILILTSLWIQTLSHTVWGSDAHTFWLAKASAFFVDGRITSKNLFLYWPYDHPLLWPLTAAWFYHFIGQANEYYFQIIPFTIFICLTMVFYKNIDKSNLWIRLFWTTILFFTPFLWGNVALAEYVGNADLLVSFYLLLSIIYLVEKKFLYTALFLFFASLVKNDAVPAVLGFLTLFPIFTLKTKKKWKTFIWFWLCLLFLFGLHLLWKRHFGLKSRYLGNLKSIDFTQRPFFEYMWYTTNAFREEFRQIYRWGLGWWLVILVFFTNLRNIFKNKILMLGLAILFIQFLSYFVIYYITPEDQASQIATSIFRLVLQIYPATLFLAYKISYN